MHFNAWLHCVADSRTPRVLTRGLLLSFWEQEGNPPPRTELPIMTLPPLPPPLFSTRAGGVFAFLPDGERLVLSGKGPKSVSRMILLSTGQDVLTFEKPPPSVRINAVSQDGKTVALAAHDSKLVICDPQTGTKKQALKIGGYTDPSGLAFAPGSQNLLHSSWDGLTAVETDENSNYSTRSLRVSGAWPDNTMYYGIAFAASGDRFASVWQSSTEKANISLLAWPSGNEIDRVAIQNYPQSYCLDQVLFSPEDQSLLLTVPDGSVASWSLADAAGTKQTETPIERPFGIPEVRGSLYSGCLSFSPDGTLLAYGLNGILGLWAWPSGKCLREWLLPGPEPTVRQIGFSPTGRELVVSCYGPGISVYRVADLLNTD